MSTTNEFEAIDWISSDPTIKFEDQFVIKPDIFH